MANRILGLVAGPALRFSHLRGLLSEASEPGSLGIRECLHARPGAGMLVKHFHALTLPQGRPRRLERALALRYGSYLLPLKLFFLHNRATAFSPPPFSGDFVRMIPHSRALARPGRINSAFPASRCSLFAFRLRRGTFWRTPFVMKEAAETIQTHWLTVTTVDRIPITVFVFPAKTQLKKRDSTRGRFLFDRFFIFDFRLS